MPQFVVPITYHRARYNEIPILSAIPISQARYNAIPKYSVPTKHHRARYNAMTILSATGTLLYRK